MSKNTKTSITDVAAQTIALSSNELMEAIETALATPLDGIPGEASCYWGAPLLIEGEPGIAKTARVRQIAATLKAPLHVFFAGPHPPESFAGALIPDGNGGAKNIVALSELRAAITGGRGIIFLDELNGAAPATQGALQSLVNERHTGGVAIPGEVRILAAQNPEEIATGGSRLAPAIANRFIHMRDVGPNVDEWISWSTGQAKWESKFADSGLDGLEDLVVKAWPQMWPETQGLFAGFMRVMGTDLLHKRPLRSHPQSSRAWPSHRTWEFARRIYTTNKIMGRSDSVLTAMVEACVGQGAGDALLTYATEANIPSPADVLAGKWEINKDRLDVVLAAYSGMTAYVAQRPDKDDQIRCAAKAWKEYGKLFEASLDDIVAPCVTMLLEKQLGVGSGIPALVEAAKPVLLAMQTRGLVDIQKEKPKQ